MEKLKKIKTALISVYNKDNIEPIVHKLNNLGITIYSTGGTYDFIKKLDIKVTSVETITSYPSILGGRVKTLHPKIFGGILSRRDNKKDTEQIKKYEIPQIDLVIVDLYPFEETINSTNDEKKIIENIDIGGISLIRAAAKNFNDVLVIPCSNLYKELINLLNEKKGYSSINDRKYFAKKTFDISSNYDTSIFNYFNDNSEEYTFKQNITKHTILRYGENPHQKGVYYGDMNKLFEQLNGKVISYNNLVDIDAAFCLIGEFSEPAFAVIKHTNPCGVAVRPKLIDAWKDALAGDPVSAFGGVIITNKTLDEETARDINKLFFEIIIAPYYQKNALKLLKSKKNRIILQKNIFQIHKKQFKSILNGVIEQTKDLKTETIADMQTVTKLTPTETEKTDLAFANIIVKHSKSNAIVLAKNKQLIASGIGQTSRVDALKQAVIKAKNFDFNLKGAVMASDAFFPFPDCVEIAHKQGIRAVIQPGGSIRDKASIDYCDNNNIAMVFTGIRHFKH